MKPRNAVRRYKRTLARLIRKSDELKMLYKDPVARAYSKQIESLLKLFFILGMIEGGDAAIATMKELYQI
jgi:hypothetical protein